ncbi:DUF4824 family protein [Methyloversatilis sp.]|uniref:DUF4824 family protein n=1 Tax=Methyloversatilis sp. TaxID=2569862 RepID=UPI003D28A27E
MRRAQKILLVGGVALIVAVNAFVLAGVAWNRSGEPGSALTLTQRELSLPYAYGLDGERGGIDVALLWRAPMRDDNADAAYDMHYGRGPDWLDADKLRELGFDLKEERDAHRQKREVYVVLELAGADWQAALAQAQRRLDRALARGDAEKQDVNAQKSAQEALKYEQQKASRLFAVERRAGRRCAAPALSGHAPPPHRRGDGDAIGDGDRQEDHLQRPHRRTGGRPHQRAARAARRDGRHRPQRARQRARHLRNGRRVGPPLRTVGDCGAAAARSNGRIILKTSVDRSP